MNRIQRFWTWVFRVSGVGPAIGLWVKVLVAAELQAVARPVPSPAQVQVPRPMPRLQTEIVMTPFDIKEAQFLAGIDCYRTPDGHLYTVFGGQSIRTQ